jgi:hypothetical protein
MFTAISTCYTFPKTIQQGLNSSEVGTKIENLGVDSELSLLLSSSLPSEITEINFVLSETT